MTMPILVVFSCGLAAIKYNEGTEAISSPLGALTTEQAISHCQMTPPRRFHTVRPCLIPSHSAFDVESSPAPGAIIPKPFQMWTDFDQRLTSPLYLLLSIAWALEMYVAFSLSAT